ncbi:MAG: hypothetical protein HY321_07795 [Armatimonadetes bacterium]|nr:hypothetical protein [Armatimonadota bacterium]
MRTSGQSDTFYEQGTTMLLAELSEEARAELVESLARRVTERRLEMPAVLFLEMHKPIAFLGGQALAVAAPLLGALFGYENVQRLALFVQSPENIEALTQRIEAMSRESTQHSVDQDGSDGSDRSDRSVRSVT